MSNQVRCFCFFDVFLPKDQIFLNLPYFMGYKREFFSFKNNPKNLDPSYKMNLDLWDCLGRVKLVCSKIS